MTKNKDNKNKSFINDEENKNFFTDEESAEFENLQEDEQKETISPAILPDKTDNKTNYNPNNKQDKYIVILSTPTYVIIDKSGNGEKIQRTNNNPIKTGDEIYLKDI